jgi:hypothetical protein
MDWWARTMDWWACTMDWWASTMDWWASTMETGDDPHHFAKFAVILVVRRIPRRMRGGIQTKSFVPENAFSCAFASVYLPQGPLLGERNGIFVQFFYVPQNQIFASPQTFESIVKNNRIGIRIFCNV